LSLSLQFAIIRFTHLQPLVTTSKVSLTLPPSHVSLPTSYLFPLDVWRNDQKKKCLQTSSTHKMKSLKERNKFLCCGRHNWHCFSAGENIGHLIFLSRCLYYNRVNSLWLLFVQTQYFITLPCFVMVYLVVDLRSPR
jgi:hypothetical protein